jgi:hypothetical protein
MSGNLIFGIVIALIAVVVSYWVGRSDGWVYRGALELKRPNLDTERLNWLETQCIPYVEGQNYSQPQGEYTANEWSVVYPATTLREAIDALSEQERIGLEELEFMENIARREGAT